MCGWLPLVIISLCDADKELLGCVVLATFLEQRGVRAHGLDVGRIEFERPKKVLLGTLDLAAQLQELRVLAQRRRVVGVDLERLEKVLAGAQDVEIGRAHV